MTRAVQDAFDDKGIVTDRMKNQIAAVDGDPNARSVFLAQRIGFRLIGDPGAMGPQFRHEGQGPPGTVSGNEKRDVFEIDLRGRREAAGP